MNDCAWWVGLAFWLAEGECWAGRGISEWIRKEGEKGWVWVLLGLGGFVIPLTALVGERISLPWPATPLLQPCYDIWLFILHWREGGNLRTVHATITTVLVLGGARK